MCTTTQCLIIGTLLDVNTIACGDGGQSRVGTTERRCHDADGEEHEHK